MRYWLTTEVYKLNISALLDTTLICLPVIWKADASRAKIISINILAQTFYKMLNVHVFFFLTVLSKSTDQL